MYSAREEKKKYCKNRKKDFLQELKDGVSTYWMREAVDSSSWISQSAWKMKKMSKSILTERKNSGQLNWFSEEKMDGLKDLDSSEKTSQIHLKFDNDRFIQLYDQATEELDIGSAAFSFVGYGDSAVEAYGEAAPAMAFRLEGDEQTGFTASYRDGQTVVEAIKADDKEDFREIYDLLRDTDAVYRGAVLEGEDDGEWIVSDYGAEDLSEVR